MTVGVQWLSVVVPVLNEQGCLGRTLDGLAGAVSYEVIVVDAGSSDGTEELARARGAKVIGAVAGRGAQMNAGARVGRGVVLLFLHADTLVPEGWAGVIEATLSRPGVVAGAFGLRIDGPARGLRVIERSVGWRSRVLGLPYGDQGLFMRAEVFERVGGFAEVPSMEDFDLVRRLRRHGRVEVAPARVLTSARRWERSGLWRTTLVNQCCVAAYLAGVSPGRIARWRGGL